MTEAARAQIVVEAARRRADEDAAGADASVDGAAVPSPEASAARPMAAGRLAELAVHDLALIEKLRISFEPGLNVLTGETGAGKSLLIDALGLAVGARADTSLVRHGSDSARVEALFDRLPEPLICVREVSAAGRSTARIDDESVTAARLAAVAGRLVEIHGQHDQQRLLDERWQRELLDAFGGLEAERAATAAAVEAWRVNQAALAELALDPRELARRLELQEHQVAEIAGAKLRVGRGGRDQEPSLVRAARRVDRPRQRRDPRPAGGGGDRRSGNHGRGGASRPRPGEARRALRAAGRAPDRPGRGAGGRGAEAATLAESVEHDPAALARLEERLSLIYSLERKYGEDEAAVIAYGERAAAEAERLRTLEASRETRQAEAARLLEAVADHFVGPIARPADGGPAAREGSRGSPRRVGIPPDQLPGGRDASPRPVPPSRQSRSTASASRSTARASTRSSS